MPTCQPFSIKERILVTSEAIRVECRYDNRTVYIDHYLFVPEKKELEKNRAVRRINNNKNDLEITTKNNLVKSLIEKIKKEKHLLNSEEKIKSLLKKIESVNKSEDLVKTLGDLEETINKTTFVAGNTHKRNIAVSNYSTVKNGESGNIAVSNYSTVKNSESETTQKTVTITKTLSDNHMSVMIFMIDALARMQFFRWLPKTASFLKNTMKVYDFAGFNKVGDNTFVNLVPLLTGMFNEEMKNICAPNQSKNYLDNCPWLWKDYQARGYRTGLSEDTSWMGAFKYAKAGFNKPPVDYFTYHLEYAAEDEIGNYKTGNVKLCMGGRPMFDPQLKFMEDFLTRFADRPYFGFVATSAYSHDDFNMPYYLDEPLYRMLVRMVEKSTLNHTMLIVMGDHGLRWGAHRATYMGKLEERLPLMTVYFPEWFRHTYPTAFTNMAVNQHRLTTFFDMHQTLRDVLNPDTLNSVNHNEISADQFAISLFHRVSQNRTCSHAKIPQHFCTCQQSKRISIKSPIVRKVIDFLLNELNTKLSIHPQCAQLSLKSVISATISNSSNDALSNDRTITVTFDVLPSDGLLEGTVAHSDQRGFSLSGPVSRISLYGHQSWCVKDHFLEKYCYCGDKT